MSQNDSNIDPQSDGVADPGSLDLDLPAEMFRSGENVEEVTVTMQRRKLGLRLVDAKFTELDGMAVFEGDIVLGSVNDVRSAEPGVLAIGRKRFGIKGEDYRWPNGVVPYVVTEALRSRVQDAIGHWEKHTPIRLVERSTEEDYLSFEIQDGCWSMVGRQGGKQIISLDTNCGLGSAIHEIGHALGLWHEQSRSDRDEHIQIVEENIAPGHLAQFSKHILDGDDLGDYDFGSIMHYPETAFSVNGLPTIITKEGRSIGQRTGLSKGDIAGIRLMYPWLNWPAEVVMPSSV